MKRSTAHLFLIAALVLLALFSGCKRSKTWQTSTFLFFDTVCEVKLYGEPYLLKNAKEEIRNIFTEIEKYFSPESQDLSSPLVRKLFQRGMEVYDLTNGCFDITVFPLSEAWGFFNRSYNIPSHAALVSSLKLVGMDKAKVTDKMIILLPGMKLDWGAIAKGFGIDLAARSLISRGVEKGFINAGGDLYCWGKNPENEDWKVGIKHPRKEGVFGILSLADTAAATTGDYQRYFVEDGIRYHHVFDPRTGYPARGKQSVTVIGPETVICDALSTALFVSAQPEEILKNFPNYNAVLIDSEGKEFRIGKSYGYKIQK
jgi:thiamine biosynthesis lipoprotein